MATLAERDANIALIMGNTELSDNQKAKVADRADAAYDPTHDTNAVANNQRKSDGVVVTPQQGAELITKGNNKARQTKWIESIRPAATKIAGELGVSPDILMAQMAQETGWGRTVRNNNFFNIKGKGGYKTSGALEYDSAGNKYYEESEFAAYDTPEEGIRGYVDFLRNNPRYKKAGVFEAKTDAEFVQRLQDAGYATDPNYAKNILSVRNSVQKYSPTPMITDEKKAITEVATDAKKTEIAVNTNKKKVEMGLGTDIYGNSAPTYANLKIDTTSPANPAFEPDLEKGALSADIEENYPRLDEALDYPMAAIGQATEQWTNAIKAVPNMLSDLVMDSTAANALRQNKEELEPQIATLRESMKDGDFLGNAAITNQITDLERQIAANDAVVDDSIWGRARVEEYLESDAQLEAFDEFGSAINEVRDKEDVNRLTTAFDKLGDETIAKMESGEFDVVKDGIKYLGAGLTIAKENPRGLIEFIFEQGGNVSLPKVANLLATTNAAYDDATEAFIEDTGRRPDNQETAIMQLFSFGAGLLGTSGDEAVKGSFKPVLAKAADLLPDNVFVNTVRKVFGIPARITAAAIMEGFAEGGENVLTQLGGVQDWEKIDWSNVLTEATLGTAAGGTIATSVEVAPAVAVAGNVAGTGGVLTGKAIVGVGKGLYKGAKALKEAPANIKAKKARDAADKEADEAEAKLKEEQAAKEAPVEEQVNAAEQTTPNPDAAPTVEAVKETVETVEDVAATADAAVNKAEKAKEPVSAKVKKVVTDLKKAGEGLKKMSGDVKVADIYDLVDTTTSITKRMRDIATETTEVLNSDIPESDRVILQDIETRLKGVDYDTVVGSLGTVINNNEEIKTALESFFIAETAPDAAGKEAFTERGEDAIDAIPEENVPRVTEEIRQALLKSTLYSGSIYTDERFTPENLSRAAELTSGDVSQQYQALADFKTMTQVTNEVLAGESADFVGTKTHIANLKSALAEGNTAAASQTTQDLDNFYKQRIKKADVLRKAINAYEDTGEEQTPVYNERGTGEAGSKRRGQLNPINDLKSLNSAKKLLRSVAEEQEIAGYALTTANALQNFTSSAEALADANAYKTRRDIPITPIPEEDVTTTAEAEPTTDETVEAEAEVEAEVTPEPEPTVEVAPETAEEVTAQAEASVAAAETAPVVSALNTVVETFNDPRIEGESDAEYVRRTTNRFKTDTRKAPNSPLWRKDGTILEILTGLKPDAILAELKSLLTALGLDTTKIEDTDLRMLKSLPAKKAWFNGKMNEIAQRITAFQNSDSDSEFKQNNVLRNLLDENGQFPAKVNDAAFMAYYNSVSPLGENFYTGDASLVKMLGLTDVVELDSIPNASQLRTLGSPVTVEDMGKAFKRALGLRLAKDTPTSVGDRIYSAMGYSLNSILQTDPEIHVQVISEKTVNPTATSDVKYRGYTVRTPDNDIEFTSLTGKKAGKSNLDSFFANGLEANNIMDLATNPENTAPSNYIDTLPPKVTTKTTHIRSSDPLTTAQVEAENAYRNVAWVPDSLMSSFSAVIGFDGFKKINGFVEDAELALLNVNDKRSAEGINYKLRDQYNKMTGLLAKMGDESKVYFASAFSLVRRQQMQGEVNPQGDKWHRAVLGVENSPTINSMNLNKLTGKGRKGNGYYFILALGQALGLDADKQSNALTYKQTADLIQAELAAIESGEVTLATELASYMTPEGVFPEGTVLPNSLLTKLASEIGDNFHKQQGTLTLAKLLRASDSDGNVKNFQHYLRFEVDGLTNGPFHSTFLTAMGNMSPEEAARNMQRGGFMVGQNTAGTHTQIGNKEFKDFYITAADISNANLADMLVELQAKVTESTSVAQKAFLTNRIKAIKFLASKAKITSINLDTDNITIERSGTKNPVTVTVYGGGSTGIHKSIANELAGIFYSEMSQTIADLEAGKAGVDKQAVLKNLSEWANAVGMKPTQFSAYKAVSATQSNTQAKEALTKITLNKVELNGLVDTTKAGIGGAITSGIDEVFSGNKQTAALMNAGLNFVTVMANDTFTRAYKGLHAKRVEEGVIGEIDSLSQNDVDILHTALQKALPFVKTSIHESSVNVAKEGRESIAGLNRVSAPSLTANAVATKGKRIGLPILQSTQVDHTTTGFSSPGVRGIPVITISVDGNTQVLNHLLQAKNGKYLNVLDAIDYASDSSIRAGNEVFNASEYVSLATSDPIAKVADAVSESLVFQAQPFEVAGITVTPLFNSADLTEGTVDPQQEELRAALNELTLPIHQGLPSFLDTGNLEEAVTYLLSQLEIERGNAEIARNRFLFDNNSLLMDQMAGIDNGGAKIVKGQLKLTSQANELMGAKGIARISRFNGHMAVRKRAWDALSDEDKKITQNSEIENIRADAAVGSKEAKAEIAYTFNTLSGLFQDMRGKGRYNSTNFSYDLGVKSNQVKFKEILFGKKIIKLDDADPSNFITNGYIPNNGILFDSKANQSGIDSLLNNTTVTIDDSLPTGINGSMTVVDGKYDIRIRKGLSSKDASTVLTHEVTHAVVANGISRGVADYLTKKQSNESILVKEQINQIGRFLKWSDKTGNTNPYSPELRRLANTYSANRNEDNLNRLLHEHMALVAANGLQAEFNKEILPTKALSQGFQQFITSALASAIKYIKAKIGKITAKNPIYISEGDVFANLLTGYATAAGTVANQSAKYNTAPEEEINLLKQGENRLDEFIRSTGNQGIAGMFRILAKIDPTNDTWRGYAEATPSQRADIYSNWKNEWLNNTDDGKKMGFWREFAAEFMVRDRENSKVIDSLQNRKTSEVDASREEIKSTVNETFAESFSEELTDAQSAVVTKGVLRADMGVLIKAGGLTEVRSYLAQESVLQSAVDEHISSIQEDFGLPLSETNVMVAEAVALGKRSVLGGSYEGFNLPNARAIARLHGTGLTGSINPQVETAIDELASLVALQQLTDTEKGTMLELMRAESNTGKTSNGFSYTVSKQAAIKRKLVKQHGSGILESLPKGYLPDSHDVGKAIKAVTKAEARKYKGWRIVRKFNRDSNDPINEDMVLIYNPEGSSVSYVQGAMSTIESSVGGFISGTGRATDTSLPSHGATAAQRKITENKRGQLRNMTKRIVDLKPKEDGMIPSINSLGEIIGYRYTITNAEKVERVGMETDAGVLLGVYDARVVEEGYAEEYNSQLATALGKDYNEASDEEKANEFVKVDAYSDDPRIASTWRVVPQHLKKRLYVEFGGNHAFVRKRDLNNAFGYREWSISNLWNEQVEDPSKFRTGMANGLEAFFGEDVAIKLRTAERLLQKSVSAAKDVIVVKSIVVPVANAASNILQLHLRGVPYEEIYENGLEGGKALFKYKEDKRNLSRAKEQLDTAVDALLRTKLRRSIAILEESIKQNPVVELIEEGLLPTVVEDLGAKSDTGLFKDIVTTVSPSIGENIPDQLLPKRGENLLIDVGREVVIADDSRLYKMLNESLEAGDFIAKYVLYKHLTNKGQSHEQAVQAATIEFINYNSLSPRTLDYLNKVGMVSFLKYFTRIQPIIANIAVNNPTRAFTTFIGADTVGLPSVFDSLWLTTSYGYTTGMYDLFGMAGGAHPLFNNPL